MKSIFNQICSVLLAVIVMCSTMSMTVNKHYCSNILIDTAVFKEAKTCGMHDISHQSNHDDEHDDENSCCSSEHEFIQGQDELQFQKTDFSIDQIVYVTAFLHSYFQLFNFEEKEEEPFKHYVPPQYAIDFQVLHQVFLI